jgi:hypothetical protein
VWGRMERVGLVQRGRGLLDMAVCDPFFRSAVEQERCSGSSAQTILESVRSEVVGESSKSGRGRSKLQSTCEERGGG